MLCFKHNKKTDCTATICLKKGDNKYEKNVKSARTLPTILFYSIRDYNQLINYKNINIYGNPVNYINCIVIIILVNQIK